MSLLTIERSIVPYQGASLGSMFNEEGTFHSFVLERSWRDNARGISQVPAGEYRLVPHDSRRHGETWALVGRTVSHYPDSKFERDLILLHTANWAYQLQGCIAPGFVVSVAEVGGPENLPSVSIAKSGPAMALLRGVLVPGSHGHWLQIIDA